MAFPGSKCWLTSCSGEACTRYSGEPIQVKNHMKAMNTIENDQANTTIRIAPAPANLDIGITKKAVARPG